ncbi:acyltransferase family protein [Lewinella sp. IMCC34183]|uniref:acyltransferase family protein n=1 Tax=Lewinella sp. IMCC34183 TaxID=2248762 RepID=UPI000E25E732|nr:acyltransferase [Lewinella sp. IMCC34183]
MVAVFTWLVWAAARGLPGSVGRLLTWRPVVYLGTISYGLYVYHLLLMHVWVTILIYLGLPRSLGVGPVRLLLLFLLTVALATLSWYLIERPINRMKSRFPYVAGDGKAGRDLPSRSAPGREMPVP